MSQDYSQTHFPGCAHTYEYETRLDRLGPSETGDYDFEVQDWELMLNPPAAAPEAEPSAVVAQSPPMAQELRLTLPAVPPPCDIEFPDTDRSAYRPVYYEAPLILEFPDTDEEDMDLLVSPGLPEIPAASLDLQAAKECSQMRASFAQRIPQIMGGSLDDLMANLSEPPPATSAFSWVDSWMKSGQEKHPKIEKPETPPAAVPVVEAPKVQPLLMEAPATKNVARRGTQTLKTAKGQTGVQTEPLMSTAKLQENMALLETLTHQGLTAPDKVEHDDLRLLEARRKEQHDREMQEMIERRNGLRMYYQIRCEQMGQSQSGDDLSQSEGEEDATNNFVASYLQKGPALAYKQLQKAKKKRKPESPPPVTVEGLRQRLAKVTNLMWTGAPPATVPENCMSVSSLGTRKTKTQGRGRKKRVDSETELSGIEGPYEYVTAAERRRLEASSSEVGNLGVEPLYSESAQPTPPVEPLVKPPGDVTLEEDVSLTGFKYLYEESPRPTAPRPRELPTQLEKPESPPMIQPPVMTVAFPAKLEKPAVVKTPPPPPEIIGPPTKLPTQLEKPESPPTAKTPVQLNPQPVAFPKPKVVQPPLPEICGLKPPRPPKTPPKAESPRPPPPPPSPPPTPPDSESEPEFAFASPLFERPPQPLQLRSADPLEDVHTDRSSQSQSSASLESQSSSLYNANSYHESGIKTQEPRTPAVPVTRKFTQMRLSLGEFEDKDARIPSVLPRGSLMYPQV